MSSSTPTSYVDLLIIGAGPAGMMAAAWASQYAISTRIVDKNESRCLRGRADGLQSRTLEIFDAFGVVENLWKTGFHDIEICTWTSEKGKSIQRTQRVLSQKVGISRFTQTCINQGLIEQTFVDFLKINDRVRVERCVKPQSLMLDQSAVEDSDAHPIEIKVRHVRKTENEPPTTTNGVKQQQQQTKYYFHADHDEAVRKAKEEGHAPAEEGELEIIKAKYLLGCDGAHSWTRQQLGLPLEGKQTDHVWGVMDIIPLSNFPDIRQACAINSAEHGSILNVPREDRLNRLYIQLSVEGRNFDRSQITPQSMLKIAQKIMAPYTLDFRYCDWWSIYQIGQRVAPRFSIENRIFLAGDAVHTHSPKLGQGMNVSMQDTYNLCWKLGAVLNGTAQRSILQTYNDERRQVALDLLAADREVARFYTRDTGESVGNDPISTDMAEIDNPDFQSIRNRMYEFLAGVGIVYSPSMLVARPSSEQHNGNVIANGTSNDHQLINSSSSSSHDRETTITPTAKQDLAPNIKLGARMPSYKVTNQAEARPVHIADLLKNTGRWRILVFAGDITKPTQAQRIQRLGASLSSPTSLLEKYTPSSQRYDSVIELITIHAAPRESVSILDFPDIFHPWDDEVGWDYWKVFVDDVTYHEGFDEAYVKYGIDRERGCVVVCRPDQHVGFIGELEDVGEDGLEGYFEGILIKQI